MNFSVDLEKSRCGIYIYSNKTATISAKFYASNVSGQMSLNMEDSSSVSNLYRWYWSSVSSFYISITNASCTDTNYKIDSYNIAYTYEQTIGNDTNIHTEETQIQGTTGQAIINLSDLVNAKLVQISVLPAISSSGGGGGGPSQVTGNVWVYPDQNAGSILFNGGPATSQQGNIYSYTFLQGTNIQLQAVPALGYEFLNWNDNITLNPWNIGNRVESFGATATFQLIPQTKGVNIYQNGSWQNTGAVKKYENGEWVDLPAHIFRNGQWEDL